MLPDLVLFKEGHISWKKEQKQGFLQPKKKNFIIIFSKFVLILVNSFKNSWGWKNTSKVWPFCEVVRLISQVSSTIFFNVFQCWKKSHKITLMSIRKCCISRYLSPQSTANVPKKNKIGSLKNLKNTYWRWVFCKEHKGIKNARNIAENNTGFERSIT